MTTARDIIKRSMMKIGALVKSENPSADEAQDALATLNGMISSWSNDSLAIYARSWETFTLTGGVGSYTIGSGGAFNTTRPTHIIQAYLRIGSIDYDVTPITDEAYNSIYYKSISTITEYLNFDNAYPLATIRLYPVPAAAYPLFLLTEKPLTQLTSLDTEISLPDGWEHALIYNLAILLAPEYSQPVDPVLYKIANDALGSLRMAVIKNRPLDAYPQHIGVRNIFTGWRR